MKPEIAVVSCGGTIGKDYLATEDHHGLNFEIGAPAWHRIWKRAQSPYDVTFVSLCEKDSLHMTDFDREIILDGILALSEDKVVITHGTDTMKLTAQTLSDDTRLVGKTIVLTGAMQPERFRDSDADFNVGMAISAVQCLPPGVYIALYGIVAPWNQHQEP